MICTNRLDLSTLQIITLYAYRWQIELMFKFLKRTLGGIHLMNHSENGVNIQFYVLMVTVLLQMRLKQICIQKNADILERKTELEKQNNMKFSDLSTYDGNSADVWIKSITSFFYRYWKIDKHWLIHLKNLIINTFDNQVVMILAKT